MADSTSHDEPVRERATNRLGLETSAYLRQHRFNPVDWYPWGEEALARARDEDRPILVSIGYSACHWCHVMERESFEDSKIAARMNEAFVNIKVDREERPDIDQIYMDTALKLNGQGGWPLNAVCTPDGRPFYVGTYFPPVARGGMPAWADVIDAVTRAWREQRTEIERNSSQIAAALSARPEGEAEGVAGPETIRRAAHALMRIADSAHGGFGNAPKFPTPTNLEFLLAALDFVEGEQATTIAQFLNRTAREMARRGLYDQLGGGFHRYCVDASWTIPHFEKMLYDQGLLLSFYAELARRCPDGEELIWPIRETVDYLRREMRGEGGAWYASQDADSEGVEGKFFVWTPAEIRDVLGKEADAFCTAYGVRPGGNFEDGTTHLVDEARQPRPRLQPQRERLRIERAKRTAPATDLKHVAAWNAYAISGLARAASLVGDATMLDDAARAANFVLDEMRNDHGQLLRVHNQGRAHVLAFLDDHAALLGACLDLQRAGAGNRYLEPALWLAQEILDRFANRATGELYLTPCDGEQLIHRPRSDHDDATPDASGLALLGLTRLAALSHSTEMESFVDAAIREQAIELTHGAHAYPTLLRAVALRTRGLSVAIVIGDPAATRTSALASRARRVLRPEDAVVVVAPGEDAAPGIAADWLSGRVAPMDRPTAYICRGDACSLPVHEPAEHVAELSLRT